MSEFSKALDEAMRLAAECVYFSPFEQAMQHMGQCEKHNIVFVEINPSKPEGCPICAGRVTDNEDGTVTLNVEGLTDES